MNNSYIYIYHVNVTQTVPDISPLMPMHQDPLLVGLCVGIHRGPVNSPHKGPVTRKMFPFDDVIMKFTFCDPHDVIIDKHDEE